MKLKFDTDMNRIPILSFFSGGGFLDIGFEMSNFDIVWSNEVEEKYAEIYHHGLQTWRTSIDPNQSGSSYVNLDSIDKLKKSKIIKEAFGSLLPKVFGLIGGPPCQDFSHSGHNKGAIGERGRFTQTFIDVICDIKPSFFLMENVPGLYKKKHRAFFDSIVKQLDQSQPGYITSAKILSALELGVPQDRDRLFLIGFRKDLVQEVSAYATLIGKGSDWFCWPEPIFIKAKDLNWPDISPFGAHEIDQPDGIPRQLMINDLVQDDAEKLPNGQDTFNPYSAKFHIIDEGDVSGKSFKRLHRYRYSPTVWYGNNEVHLHPWKPRRLSVREALRIQTVPDEYVMPATSTLTDKFRVISNGVPTQLALQIGNAIQKFILQNALQLDTINITEPS